MDDVVLNKCASIERSVARARAVHEYQRLQMPIVEAVIRDHLDDLLRYASTVLGRAGLA